MPAFSRLHRVACFAARSGAVSLALLVPALAQPVAAPPATALVTDVAPASVAAVRLRAEDSDTLPGFAAEGAALYARDPVKLSGYDYCGQAVTLAERGEFRSSARAAARALHVGQAEDNDDLRALATRDLAIVFSYAGQLDKAEQFARQALTHAAKRPELVTGPAWKVIGDAQARRGASDEAITSYRQALAGSSARFKPLVLASLANLYIEAGQPALARQALGQVELAADQTPLRGALRRTEARLLLAEGRRDEALATWTELAQASGGLDGAYDRMWALDGIAQIELTRGNRPAAAAALAGAVDSLDRVRAQFRSEEIKMGLFSDLQTLFERAIATSVDLGDDAQAFALSDRSRSRALLDAVRGRAETGAAAAGGAAGLAAGLASTKTGIAALRARLAPDERLVQYHVLADRTIVWLIGPQVARSAVLPLGREALGEQVEALRGDIVNGRRRAYASADALGQALLGPLELQGGERLVVVPHGPLHYLPFQALRLGQRFLIESHPIAVVPSASVAVQLADRGQREGRGLVAFGNPQIDEKYDLPGAELEVGELARAFPGARTFVRAAASKSAFRKAAGDGRIVHVAAHAEADRLDPLHSRVLLANEEGARNFLEAQEVMGLDLGGVALVTLSACESALGRVAGGDEVLGFPRAFLSAGAGGMIASLWPVSDDSTALLMSTLYAELARGVDVQRAMQAGQLAVLRTPALRHPFYWAPFNLIGNWRLTFAKAAT
jgi:CHAT domain-containing protein